MKLQNSSATHFWVMNHQPRNPDLNYTSFLLLYSCCWLHLNFLSNSPDVLSTIFKFFVTTENSSSSDESNDDDDDKDSKSEDESDSSDDTFVKENYFTSSSVWRSYTTRGQVKGNKEGEPESCHLTVTHFHNSEAWRGGIWHIYIWISCNNAELSIYLHLSVCVYYYILSFVPYYHIFNPMY